MKFKKKQKIYCTKGTELYFHIIDAVGSDATKEIYLGGWVARRCNPNYPLDIIEYLVLKKNQLKDWTLYDAA